MSDPFKPTTNLSKRKQLLQPPPNLLTQTKKEKKNPCQRTCPVLQSQNPHTGQSQAFKAPKSTAIPTSPPTSPPQNPSKTPYQKILSILTTTIDNPFSHHAPKTSGTTSKHRCKLTQISLKPQPTKNPTTTKSSQSKPQNQQLPRTTNTQTLNPKPPLLTLEAAKPTTHSMLL